MSDLNSNSKVALGIASFLALAGGIGYLLTREQRPKKKKVNPEQDAKAKEFREKGNEAFKTGKFEEAVEHYTQALLISTTDEHILYSNRSAAYFSLGKFEEALDDGKRSVEIEPTWTKGYFRMAVCLLKMYQFDDAYINCLKGLKKEPKSSELTNLLKQISNYLGSGDQDIEAKVERRVLERHIRTSIESVLNSHFGEMELTFDKFRETVLGMKSKADLPPMMVTMLEKDKKIASRLFATLFLSLGLGFDALSFAQDAYKLDENDPQTLILLAKLKVQQPTEKRVGGISMSVIESLELIRRALKIDPNDPEIANILGSVSLRFALQCNEPVHHPIEMKGILRDLKIAISNPNAKTITIFQAGMALWSLLIQHPEIKKMADDIKNDQALLDIIYLDPFFIEAISKAPISNIRMESLLSIFRSSSSVANIPETTFPISADLLYALGMQGYRSNYA